MTLDDIWDRQWLECEVPDGEYKEMIGPHPVDGYTFQCVKVDADQYVIVKNRNGKVVKCWKVV